eukprot:TRINITY_DN3239_c0_g1_i1.p1 TRINITY_DN3239_c0_g1~~TRINITY_DN3239_c0_g1_i1.p1  ORF type:complete len:589 (-),score=105.27 TRINITY_DN3239_c0_g1_i1:436-2202(-)
MPLVLLPALAVACSLLWRQAAGSAGRLQESEDFVYSAVFNITNTGEQRLSVTWLGAVDAADGERLIVGHVSPEETLRVDTFVSHCFEVAVVDDASEQVQAMVLPVGLRKARVSCAVVEALGKVHCTETTAHSAPPPPAHKDAAASKVNRATAKDDICPAVVKITSRGGQTLSVTWLGDGVHSHLGIILPKDGLILDTFVPHRLLVGVVDDDSEQVQATVVTVKGNSHISCVFDSVIGKVDCAVQTAPAVSADKDALELVECANATEVDALDEGRTFAMYACNKKQLKGLHASVYSLIAAAKHPKQLSIYLVVSGDPYQIAFNFGLPEKCLAVTTTKGAFIKVVGIDNNELFRRLEPQLDRRTLEDRGDLAAVENFARFYISAFIKTSGVVVYLDADTIVLDDIAEMQRELQATNRTIGFVRRDPSLIQRMEVFLRNPSQCASVTPVRWSQSMVEHEAYNVGVVAINVGRWQELKISERVEKLVQQHNDCEGGIWIGGSQPPMLLAFLQDEVYHKQAPDYHLFEDKWNAEGLGYKEHLSKKSLSRKSILHWNGPRKPWLRNGLFKDLWQPSYDKVQDLFQKKPLSGEDL